MSKSKMFLTLAALSLFCLSGLAHAQVPQVLSLLDAQRMSVGVRAYREWNTGAVLPQDYLNDYRVAVPIAWQLTGLDDPAVKFPLSITSVADYGITSKSLRFQVGLTLLIKKAGK